MLYLWTKREPGQNNKFSDFQHGHDEVEAEQDAVSLWGLGPLRRQDQVDHGCTRHRRMEYGTYCGSFPEFI